MLFNIIRSVLISIWFKPSSIKFILLFLSSALDNIIFCLCPPDKLIASSSTILLYPSNSSFINSSVFVSF